MKRAPQFKNAELMGELYKKPVDPKPLPTMEVRHPNLIHEVDLLHFTNDGGYHYVLTVVDPHNGLVEAEPLKDRNMGLSILPALTKMYAKSRYLLKPQVLQGDGEFNNSLARDWAQEQDVTLKIAVPTHHRQQSAVENANRLIGRNLWLKQVDIELTTGKSCTTWRKWLPETLREINDPKLKRLDDDHQRKEQRSVLRTPILDRNQVLLEIGTQVRVKLTEPEDVRGQKQQGRFRATDIRWRNKIYKVDERVIVPNQPPMYYVRDLEGKRVDHLLPYADLQVVSPSLMVGEPKTKRK
jgi:hypothetical protein